MTTVYTAVRYRNDMSVFDHRTDGVKRPAAAATRSAPPPLTASRKTFTASQVIMMMMMILEAFSGGAVPHDEGSDVPHVKCEQFCPDTISDSHGLQ